MSIVTDIAADASDVCAPSVALAVMDRDPAVKDPVVQLKEPPPVAVHGDPLVAPSTES